MYPYGGDVPADPGASAEGKTSLSMGVGVGGLNSWEQGHLLPATFTLLFPRSQALVADPGTLGAYLPVVSSCCLFFYPLSGRGESSLFCYFVKTAQVRNKGQGQSPSGGAELN